ncbi:hypothetical protein EK21DRAFT_82333, partial [Setomelanomma holmii]
REVYKDSLDKLKHNSFESKEAKLEWQNFVGQLTSKELAMVEAAQWEEREHTPMAELTDLSGKTVLEGDVPYVKFDNSDECEEEIDSDPEIKAYLNKVEDEYKTSSEQDVTKGEAVGENVEAEEETAGNNAESNKQESKWEGFPDSDLEDDNAALGSSETKE